MEDTFLDLELFLGRHWKTIDIKVSVDFLDTLHNVPYGIQTRGMHRCMTIVCPDVVRCNTDWFFGSCICQDEHAD